jgi:agmatine/peptidylarginine deiminase
MFLYLCPMQQEIIFPAEWHPQSAVQLTWPHEDTDWAPALDEVIPCFVAIAQEVMKREKLLVVCRNANQVRRQLGQDAGDGRIIFREINANDTWARDHGAISVWENGLPRLYDFVFNGWGMKYAAGEDNLITRRLLSAGTFAPAVQLISKQPFVLEGGSIDSDGNGSLLTTAACLASLNRNEHMSKEQIDAYLKETLGLKRILWLEDGFLEGDDTDAHVDTLARFCAPDAIAYVQCDDPADNHFDSLRRMENCLKTFRQENGQPYRLFPLPMADKVVWNGERLPATYANFLIINGAVLLPFYGSPKDKQAADVLQTAFPGREIIGINCLPLIRQHGSLHCLTMQYPIGFI